MNKILSEPGIAKDNIPFRSCPILINDAGHRVTWPCSINEWTSLQVYQEETFITLSEETLAEALSIPPFIIDPISKLPFT